MNYYISDLHLGHKNIIKYCNRPFQTVDEMDEHIIKNLIPEGFNTKKDVLWLLGDIFMNRKYKWNDDAVHMFFQALPRFGLILGNHDEFSNILLDSLHNCVYVGHYKELIDNNKKIVLCHYPLESWNGDTKGSVHLHGHCHGNLEHKIENRYDVGVDVQGYTAKNLFQIKETV